MFRAGMTWCPPPLMCSALGSPLFSHVTPNWLRIAHFFTIILHNVNNNYVSIAYWIRYDNINKNSILLFYFWSYFIIYYLIVAQWIITILSLSLLSFHHILCILILHIVWSQPFLFNELTIWFSFMKLFCVKCYGSLDINTVFSYYFYVMFRNIPPAAFRCCRKWLNKLMSCSTKWAIPSNAVGFYWYNVAKNAF